MAKYPWGAEAFTMPFMFGCMMFDSILVGVILALSGTEGNVVPVPVVPVVQTDTFPLRGVVAVSTTFVIVCYLLLGNQIGVTFGGGDADMKKIAERGVYNNVEQAIPFLILLWLNAVYVNPRTTAILGWVYVVARFLYPICYGFYGVFNNLVEVVQQLTYAINWYFILAIFYRVKYDTDLHQDVAATSEWLMILIVLFGVVLNLIAFLIGGKPGSMVIIKGVQWHTGVGIEDEESGSE